MTGSGEPSAANWNPGNLSRLPWRTARSSPARCRALAKFLGDVFDKDPRRSPTSVPTRHGLVDGWPGWLLGLLFAAVAIGVRAVWMAPTSARRLHNPRRLIAQTALFVVVGGLVSLAGWPVWGIGFAIVATAAFASRRADRMA